MATEVIMPKVDMVMEMGTVVEWLKQEGDPVKEGEPLLVIMTQKASIEVQAPSSGILAGVMANPGQEIPVAQVIAYILGPGESLPTSPQDRPQPATPAGVEARRPEPGGADTSAGKAASGKVRATPVARRLAAELGMDLAQISGRGPFGRIQQADVLSAVGARSQAVSWPARASIDASTSVGGISVPPIARSSRQPLAGVRKIVAERMAHSAFTAPHITLSLSVDMSEATRLRDCLLEPTRQRTGLRLSFTAILCRAVASALMRHPYLNATLEGDDIVLWSDVHLGVATSLDDCLIVPVIRDAQTKGLEQIVTELGSLVERARARRLSPAEMTGSTFTISNLGMFGVESFTAIINPPEAAILAVGKIVDAPVGIDGQIQLRPIMHLTLSADHRIVDGVVAARFLAELKAIFENPYLLLS